MSKAEELPAWQYRYLRDVFKSILNFGYTVKSYGLENLEEIQRGQGFLLAANHGSIVDAFLMGLEVQSHRVRFVGRHRTLWSNPIFGKINDIIGTIPVPERKAGGKSMVIKVSVDALKKGYCVGIFPEGAILNQRKRFEGKSGMARMALEGGVPIVPVGLLGTDGLWPYGAKMPRLGRSVQMHVGEVIHFDEYYGMHENREVVRYVTDVVMHQIRKLSGWYSVPAEHVVHWYQYYATISPPEV